jgi:putative transposase
LGELNRTQCPSDVIALLVLWRLRYKLSLRDLAEMFLIRGIVFSYETVRYWKPSKPALAEVLRPAGAVRVGGAGTSTRPTSAFEHRRG